MIIKWVSHYCLRCLQTRLCWLSTLSSKLYTAETILPQSLRFQVERTYHHCKRACLCTQVRGSECNGRRELGHASLSCLSMVFVVISVSVICCIIENNKSRAMTAYVDRSILPFCSLSRSDAIYFNYSCKNRQMVALLCPKYQILLTTMYRKKCWSMALCFSFE